MNRLVVAFDCDGTLFTEDEAGSTIPNDDVLELAHWFLRNGHSVIVWSSAGEDFARKVAEKFGLTGARTVPKGSVLVDIAVDDHPETTRGRVVIHV